MISPLVGWSVVRAIPPELWSGLITGQYKLYGGVIRGAAGTAQAGQIIRHLIPVNVPSLDLVTGLVNTYQLHRISGKVNALTGITQQVLQMATGTMALSGLNVAISSMGFIALSQQLRAVDNKLSEIQKDVRAIRTLLERAERAELRAAIQDVLNIDTTTSVEHRHTILHNTRSTLARIRERYTELLASADSPELAIGYEEYFCITGLMQVRCTAELGMIGVARRELTTITEVWQKEARRVAKTLLVDPNPERFLASDFVQDVPIASLVEWLDFAYSEEKGYIWIDELRQKTQPWYSQSWLPKPSLKYGANGFPRERELVLPALRKLVARNNVFEGYTTQYELLAAQNMRPSEFETMIQSLPPDSVVDGFVILQPDSLMGTAT